MEIARSSSARASRVDGAQSIERAINVLRAVGAGPEAGSTLSNVMNATGLSKTTAHRLLSVLTRDGLIKKSDDAQLYHLGEEIYVLGTLAAPRYGWHQLALPAVHRLATSSQDSAFLCLISGEDVVCVHREEGTYPIRTHVLQPGDRHPLGYASFGVAILAAMDKREAMRVLERNASRIKRGRWPHFSIDSIKERVDMAREKGYSVNPGLNYPESWGIAAAVLDENDAPVAALTINAIRSRMQPERQSKLAAMLKSECQSLRRQIRNLRSKNARLVVTTAFGGNS